MKKFAKKQIQKLNFTEIKSTSVQLLITISEYLAKHTKQMRGTKMTDSAIREGHLMPASNVVDEMLKNASIPRKCGICGKEYIKTELNLLGKTKIVYSLPCNCLQLQKEKQELEKRKERLRKKYQKAGIS